MMATYVGAGCVPEPSPGTGRMDTFGGTTPNGFGGTGAAFGFPMQPHLAILSLGINDCNNAGSRPTTPPHSSKLIQAAPPRPAERLGPAAHRLQPGSQQLRQHLELRPGRLGRSGWQLMYQYAQIYNCAVLNTHAKWGEYPNTQGFLSNAANVHPLDAGHADILSDLLKLL